VTILHAGGKMTSFILSNAVLQFIFG
jgi:hypothetical protein